VVFYFQLRGDDWKVVRGEPLTEPLLAPKLDGKNLILRFPTATLIPAAALTANRMSNTVGTQRQNEAVNALQ